MAARSCVGAPPSLMVATQDPTDRAALVLPELLSQFVLGSHQNLLPRGRQILSGAIDVEGEHGERGAKRIGLAAPAALRRALQRGRNPPGILGREHTALEGERVAVLGHSAGPAPARARCPPGRARALAATGRLARATSAPLGCSCFSGHDRRTRPMNLVPDHQHSAGRGVPVRHRLAPSAHGVK